MSEDSIQALKRDNRALRARITELEGGSASKTAPGNDLMEEIRRQREELRLVLDSVPATIWFKDTENRFLKVNRAAAEILGLAREEIEGRSGFELFGDHATQYYRDDQEIFSSGRSKSGIIQPVVTASGRRRWLKTDKILCRDSSGEITGLVVFAVDITELHRAQRELQRLTADLQRSNEELEHFAFTASHELKEPLRKIRIYAERVQELSGGSVGDEAHDCVERIRGATERFERVVDDLLGYALVASEETPFTDVNLADVATGVLGELEFLIQETGGRVDVADLPTVVADPQQMRLLLKNLLSNSLKFRRDHESPIMNVRANIADTSWQLVVSDNGIGFDEKHIDRIFKVFQRLHCRLEYSGTGIGLAVARKIVERHGGVITASSAPGRGATFTSTFPLPEAGPASKEPE